MLHGLYPTEKLGFMVIQRSRDTAASDDSEPHTNSFDCEDRFCSLMVMGCGPAIAGVTLHLTGLVPFLGLVRSWSPAPARSE